MVLSSAGIFFQNQFFVVVFFFRKKIGIISRVSSSLDPDHARRV